MSVGEWETNREGGAAAEGCEKVDDKSDVYRGDYACLLMLRWEFERVWRTAQSMKNRPVCLRVRENVSL